MDFKIRAVEMALDAGFTEAEIFALVRDPAMVCPHLFEAASSGGIPKYLAAIELTRAFRMEEA